MTDPHLRYLEWLRGVPEIGDIVARIQEGHLPLDQGMMQIASKLSADPDLAQALYERALQEGTLYQTEKTPLPRLGPQYEAALIERVQFDGDVPELRTGPLPEGTAPAIPVENPARNLAVLGDQLERASREAQKLLENTSPEADDALESEGALQRWTDPFQDPPTYRRGQPPVPRTTFPSSGSDIQRWGDARRRWLASHAVLTTQGRRSITSLITRRVVSLLREAGMVIQEGGPPEEASLSVEAAWTVDAFDAASVQPDFDLVAVASSALAQKLIGSGRLRRGGVLWVRVRALHDIADRVVGWSVQGFQRLLAPAP